MNVEKWDDATLDDCIKNGKSMNKAKWDHFIPTSWNHLKKQYVAIIYGTYEKYDGLERKFISNLKNRTSSGKNAELEANEPQQIGSVVEVKDGSHKYMSKSLWLKKEDGYWHQIAERENYSQWYYDTVEGEEEREEKKDELSQLMG